MDPRFVGFYERELKHVREMGGEFARQFPKIAGRLGLDAFGCADPYVERMIESFAFLTARIQMKLQASQGEFTEQMLELLYPGYLAPTPSLAVMQLQPNLREGRLASGVVVPRGASLRSALGEQQTACDFRTAHPVTLWPIELESADYRSNVAELIDTERVAAPNAKAALRLVLKTSRDTPFNALGLDTLPLFLRGGEIAQRLYEQLLGANIGMVVQSTARPHAFLRHVPQSSVAPLGFEADEALLPSDDRSFEGYRLLHEFFAFPERFMFAELRGLRELLSAADSGSIELTLLFDRADPRLDGAVRAANFALFCTPAINLFPRTSDRIPLRAEDAEQHVVVDRTRPLDFEVHSITKLQGYGSDGEAMCDFTPLYAPTPGQRSRYTVRRQARALKAGWLEREQDTRSPYVPSEVFVSLVDGEHGAARPGLKQLSVSALCTNRALPLLLRTGEDAAEFTEQSGAPVSSVRCLAGPTAPRSSGVFGDVAWGLLSHLSLDYASLMGRDGQAANSLRQLLRLYANFANRSTEACIDGIVDVQTSGVVRPLAGPGPLTFGRGVEVTVTCDESAFAGTSAFLLGAVLSRFFAKYASINSFAETVLRTQQRGAVMRWPVTRGRRPTL